MTKNIGEPELGFENIQKTTSKKTFENILDTVYVARLYIVHSFVYIKNKSGMGNINQFCKMLPKYLELL